MPVSDADRSISKTVDAHLTVHWGDRVLVARTLRRGQRFELTADHLAGAKASETLVLTRAQLGLSRALWVELDGEEVRVALLPTAECRFDQGL